ncbi:reverse transcriptase domain-containing protein [uncultured Desulfobacter sp.]|uniref:reverse transcriptase domain-containing protein n=1 Tax=uncultured Desulfobacter sp. TaxID=240139 RepID=UPI002AAC2873|nr:reverse transcriptase domain-containing protein [uncultured Desulfobacter sp.]
MCSFDRVNHDRLIYLLSGHVTDKKILRLIGMILCSGVMANSKVLLTKEGTVQGSPLSPLLSNVVLDELDKELERRGLEFCRYADDCNIFVRSPKAANRVIESISKFIEGKLKLKINRDKSRVGRSEDVKFLGTSWTIRNPGCNEHCMVQKAGIILSSRQKAENSRTTVRLLIEERYTWPVRAVL